MKKVLRECRAEVEVAGSAAEALDMINARKPDVLLSDIGMPGEDGYELIRTLRANYPAKDLPAAALTAFARSEDRQRACYPGSRPMSPSPSIPRS